MVASIQFARYFYDGHVGLSLMDEGYLWQGMDAVKAGLIPIRDFHGYDPGRYYWVAAWSYVFGDGLVAMRQSCVVFSVIGVFLGCLACSRISRSWWFLSAIALILSLWMEPRYKAFEQAISLAVIYVATVLLESPTKARHFWAGIFVGALAVFGRNHAVYAAFSFIGLQALLLFRDGKPQFPKMLAWSGGVTAGFLPYGASIVFVPGLFAAYLAQLKKDVGSGTNLFCPIPWPWSISTKTSAPQWLHEFVVGACFVTIILSLVLAAFWIIREFLKRRAPLQESTLVAALAVTATYSHHAFSRADLVHLSHVGAALMVVCVAFVAAWCKKAPRLGLWLGTVFAAMLTLPSVGLVTGAAALALSSTSYPVEMEVRKEPMNVARYEAQMVMIGRYVTEKLMADGENIAFIPHTPGLYPITNRICPLYQSYFILPSSETEQDATIEQLNGKRVNWIVLQDIPLDGRNDLRFRNTDKKVFAFISQNYEVVQFDGLNKNTKVLKRKL